MPSSTARARRWRRDVRENRGTCPADAKGKRIRGVLRNGIRFGFEPVANAVPLGWASETTNWRLADSPFDVVEFEVI